MIQLQTDRFRAWRADRHRRAADRSIGRHDFWRAEVFKPWSNIVPHWLPWVAVAAFWLLLFAWVAL